jgi:hypothetical protein
MKNPAPKVINASISDAKAFSFGTKGASDRGGVIADDHEIEHLQEIAAGDPNDVQDFGPTT